jgi:lathosterol oxidase
MLDGMQGDILLFLSFFLVHQTHDAYFYWTHRWMHEWNGLKNIICGIISSRVPTPLAAYSFHPVEAIVQGLFWF